MTGRTRDTDMYDPRHPHEPERAPVIDVDGRCLVCAEQVRDATIDRLARENGRLRELLDQFDRYASIGPGSDDYLGSPFQRQVKAAFGETIPTVGENERVPVPDREDTDG